jgi:hypothetical protein
MKKLIFIILLLSGSIFGQTINWSDVSVNYPITKDDSASVLYATARVDTVKAIHINKILRMIRLLQDKVGFKSKCRWRFDVLGDGRYRSGWIRVCRFFNA